MTIPRMMSLSAYWKSWPPIHEMIAVYLGYGKSASETGEQGESLLDLFPQTKGK